jgi:hypothetical protein
VCRHAAANPRYLSPLAPPFPFLPSLVDVLLPCRSHCFLPIVAVVLYVIARGALSAGIASGAARASVPTAIFPVNSYTYTRLRYPRDVAFEFENYSYRTVSMGFFEKLQASMFAFAR